MSAAPFYIETVTGREVIKSDRPGFKLTIYRLKEEPFSQGTDTFTLFAGDQRMLAFEASADPAHIPDIINALQWYSSTNDISTDSLTVKDPRRRAPMKVVR